MSGALVSPEEVRDTLALADRPVTVAFLADDLAVSVTTVRRHLHTLIQRGHAIGEWGRGRNVTYRLTDEGRRASDENEGL